MKKILLILLTFIYSFSVELTTKVLEPNEAFKTSFTKNQDSLTLKLELGKDIYLYDDKLKILIKKPQEIEITKEINIPKAVAYEEYIVHFDNLNLTIPFDLLKSKIDSKEFEIEVKFQGCSKLGLCYAPISEKHLLIIDEKIENKEQIKFAKKSIRKLRASILDDKLINYFLEEEQSLDKALNIFIRINSGAKPLSFSDLLMSIAVANWEKKDARKEIHQLVDNIREKGFNISKDLILKSYLYLYSKDIKFRVTNFSKQNAQNFEAEWEKIRNTILETFNLIRSFGFNEVTLTSKNAVLPIIYYLYHSNKYESFTNKANYKDDRESIKIWLHKVLIKQVFGGTSDNTLSQIRKAFTIDFDQKYLADEITDFPYEEILKQIRKDTAINADFIEELLNTQKDSKYSFSILSLIYPYLDYKNNNFHKDHLHPESKFSDLSDSDKTKYSWGQYNSICNLQMLDANENMSKNGKSLNEWVEKEVKTKDRTTFLENHLIPDVDLELNNFDNFYTSRKKILTIKLTDLLS